MVSAARGPGERHAAYVAQPGREQLVGAAGDPAGGVGVGRAAVRRVVLEAAVRRRVVRRGDDDAVGAGRVVRALPRLCRRIACETAGVGVYRSRLSTSTVTSLAASTSSAVAQAGSDSPWVSRPMNSGPVDALRGAVLADRLGGGDDVRLVEGGVEARAAVAGGAERPPAGRGRRGRARSCSRRSPAAGRRPGPAGCAGCPARWVRHDPPLPLLPAVPADRVRRPPPRSSLVIAGIACPAVTVCRCCVPSVRPAT